MAPAGTLSDTYLAAIQHDLAELPPESTLVGVVRKPTRWFSGAVDENIPELGPPDALLSETKIRQEDMKMQGFCDEEAHNAAWEDCDFEANYREHLQSGEAQEAMARLRERLDAGENLALVCFENTQKKRCHRTILREELDANR
ncbi:DUF488 family protein [Haladaptatus sp. GCM10025707]|uniref:DUF488 family protein, N3 subclade n=1 Tax=unclassified Haladaptatus TaxID=2622732 RepID=UPI0023E75FC3|nr:MULTISPECIES: DUF488 family protein [unclassified Haladaptatus]